MPDKTVRDIPEIVNLRLVTVYSDETTSLVSLNHRVEIANFDGEEPQDGIPHLYITDEIEAAAARLNAGPDFVYNDDFPGWDAVYDYIDRHPEILSTRHFRPTG